MKNGDKPASPFFDINENVYGDAIYVYDATGGKQILPFSPGLTKREYFAAMAMQGYIASYGGTTTEPNVSIVVKKAVEYADALLKELESE